MEGQQGRRPIASVMRAPLTPQDEGSASGRERERTRSARVAPGLSERTRDDNGAWFLRRWRPVGVSLTGAESGAGVCAASGMRANRPQGCGVERSETRKALRRGAVIVAEFPIF